MSVPALLPHSWPSIPLSSIARLSPIERLEWREAQSRGVEIYVKREELLHPQLSGNKFYKLFGHWQSFKSSGKHALLSFGGAYSNHLYALAAFGQQLGIPTIGIIRGDEPAQPSATLTDIKAMGMDLRFVERSLYRQRHNDQWLSELQVEFPQAYIVPEGGAGADGALGCKVWAQETLEQFGHNPDAICVAVGTGCSAAGILAGAGSIPLHAYLALKYSASDAMALREHIFHLSETLLSNSSAAKPLNPSIVLETNYHCGGYAKFPSDLKHFMLQFEEETGVPLDPVYTVKLFWGLRQQLQAGSWQRNSRILVLHTGGLQGRRGFGL